MKMSVIIRLKNSVLYEAIKRRRWTIKQAAEFLSMSPNKLGLIINLKSAPKRLTENQVNALYELTGKNLDEIWPEDSRDPEFLKVKKTFEGSIDIDPEKIIIAQGRKYLLESPADIAIRNQGKEIIKDVLSKLKNKHRFVLKRLYFDGKTQNEIAEEMNLTKARVSTIKICALNELRRPKHKKKLMDAF